MRKLVNNPNFDLDEDGDEVAETMSHVLRSLGFNVTQKQIRNGLESMLDDPKRKKKDFKTIDKNVSAILNLITSKKKGWKRTFSADTNYTLFFRQELKAIASIVGLVSELDNVQSFREDDEARFCYSAPNYIINLCKTFKNDARRKKFVD